MNTHQVKEGGKPHGSPDYVLVREDTTSAVTPLTSVSTNPCLPRKRKGKRESSVTTGHEEDSTGSWQQSLDKRRREYLQQFDGRQVLLQRDGRWLEGRVVGSIPHLFTPPRWLIFLENERHTTGEIQEVQRWLNSWNNPQLYFCTPAPPLASPPPARCTPLEDAEEDQDNTNNEGSGNNLIACPRCNHSFCGRVEWISRYAPTPVCGRTITPAGCRYCCNCGNFYGPHSPEPATQRDDERGSPRGIAPLGRLPPSTTITN